MKYNAARVGKLMSESMPLSVKTSTLGFDYDLVIEDWNQKLNGYRVYASGMKEKLEGGTGLSLHLMVQSDQGQSWESKIPPHLVELSQPFAEFQFQMLWLAANSKSARQLLEIRPLLLALICDRFTVDSEIALAIGELGQRKILNTLGYCHSSSVLKFIDKLDVDYSNGAEFVLIKQKLRRESERYLKFRYQSSVNYLCLILDHTHPFLSGTNFGLAVARMKNMRLHAIGGKVEDTLQLGRRLNKGDIIKRIGKLNSIEALRKLHDNWSDEYRRERHSSPDVELINPDEPYARVLDDSVHIKQIMSLDELRYEADEQKHCVEIYHNLIARGEYAVFKMSEPQRVTIGVLKQYSGTFPHRIEQISGFRNAFPSEETRSVVYQWFEKCKGSWLEK